MKNIKLNPTLKKILIRTGCVVGSLCVYGFLMHKIDYMEIMVEYDRYFIFCEIARFVIPLLLVWLNMRKLSKPIRSGIMALFVLNYATCIFQQRIDPKALNLFFMNLENVGFVFIALASLLPIWLKDKQVDRLAVCSKIAVWTAVIWMSFAVAFPEIKFDDFRSQGAYTGIITMKNGRLYLANKDDSTDIDKPPYQQRVFAFVSNWRRFGYDGTYQTVQVMIPTDSTCREYRSRAYRRIRGEDFMINERDRDTIWLREGGAIYNPDHNTMENIELIALRHHWQYRVWQQLRTMFGPKN